MVSTFTPAKQLEEPARGDYVGTWDTPVNSNMSIIDRSFGGLSTIALTNSNVVLSATQYQGIFLTFTGTITANIAITFPPYGSIYTVQNNTSGNFTITLQTTAAGGQAIGCPPNNAFDIMNDGTNIKFRGLPPVGTFWDYVGSATPSWLTACTVAPWLACTAVAFSSATYPTLRDLLGSATTPDHRGRYRAALNQGAGRITSSGGIDGDTNLSTGGVQLMTMARANLPNVSITSTGTLTQSGVPAITPNSGAPGSPVTSGGGTTVFNTGTFAACDTIQVTHNLNGGVSQTQMLNLPPTLIGGITFIRAG